MLNPNTYSYLLIFSCSIMASCGANELEERIEKLENRKRNLENTLGTNESLFLDFTYTEPDQSPINLKRELSLKSTYTNNLISKSDDDFYRITIERFSDIGDFNNFYANLYYNPTIDSISDYSIIYSTGDEYNREHRIQYFLELEEHYGSIKLNVLEFDISTGKVEFTVDLSTPSFFYFYYGNYPETTTSLRAEFKGYLRVANGILSGN